MNLYTIGFTQKTAGQFFESLKNNNIDLLLDVRLNNKSQLAGFTKSDDLPYFLKEICGAAYIHALDFAPTKAILDDYKAKKLKWCDYEHVYFNLIHARDAESHFCRNFPDIYAPYHNIVLLCSEPTADNCHRRLAAEAICKFNADIQITHL